MQKGNPEDLGGHTVADGDTEAVVVTLVMAGDASTLLRFGGERYGEGSGTNNLLLQGHRFRVKIVSIVAGGQGIRR